MHYFRVKEDNSSVYTGHVEGSHKWGLPGIRNCPACKATWGTDTRAYPSVDLSPVATLADFEEPRAEPIEEYERLCELVRPFLPPGALLQPGAALGPLVGRAQGRFGPLVAPSSWALLVQHEALQKLQAEGLRGLNGCRTQLRFRQRNSPELLELELPPIGRLHPDCLPLNRKPPCPRCGRRGLTRPDDMLLDAATLPCHLDLFRLEDFSTVIVCTERFVDACRRLGLHGVTFQPLPMK
ncbi:SitI6 family double-CXXCG motif immunity protein [Archangium lansingense]|uniref:Double-CXXCG motif protein n=1 Tax=Archangium lansingense TaxID=2995310 RepID=A0ABT3ZV15_9BACT|nr:double-CXXCG motif protein [Archangium lansinium]MCY1073240.1 double-CXXCG motif protein [Archangium lansinium]